MRKLSYFILGIIILLVAIFVLTPYFIGSRLQTHVTQQLTKLEHKHPNVKVTINKYDRHWFSADATMTLKYRMPFIFNGLSPSQPITLVLNAHIEHGPVISYTVDGKKYHQLGQSAIVLTSPDMQGDILSILDWNHSTHVVFDVEQFSNKTNTSNILIKNLTGFLNYNHRAKQLDYDLKIGHFNNQKSLLPGIHDNIATANSELKGMASKEDGLWVGKFSFKRESTSITRNNMPALEVKNIDGTLNSHVTNHRASYQVKLNAADVALAGQQLGALSYTASLNDADAQALSQLVDAAKRLYLQGNVSFSNFAGIYAPTFTLIEKGLTFNIQNFTLNLPDSKPIKLTASLQFITAPQGVSLLNALKYMSLHAKLSLPQEFVTQQLTEFYQDMLAKSQNKTAPSASAHAQQTLQRWIDHHMLIPNDGSLDAVITVKDGEALVNDKKPNFK